MELTRLTSAVWQSYIPSWRLYVRIYFFDFSTFLRSLNFNHSIRPWWWPGKCQGARSAC